MPPRAALPDPPVHARAKAAYGDGLGRCFGLRNAPALCVELAGRSTFAATLLRCDSARAGVMNEIPAQDVYLAALHLTAVDNHETWLAGRLAAARGYEPGALQILDLREGAAVRLAGPWEALSLYLPRSLVRAVSSRNGEAVEHLACEPGVADPVLAHLGAAVIALLARQPPSRALLRRVAMATCAHLVHAHGVAPDAPPRGHRARR